MNHYKSWSGLKKKLEDRLADELKGRITYFLTYYHKVHNSYGRASVRLDGNDLIIFSWTEMITQEKDAHERWKETGDFGWNAPELKEKWNKNAELTEQDFTASATQFLNMDIKTALESPDYIIRLFAIMDKRVGKRTLEKIKSEGSWKELPEWIRQIYEIRLGEKI